MSCAFRFNLHYLPLHSWLLSSELQSTSPTAMSLTLTRFLANFCQNVFNDGQLPLFSQLNYTILNGRNNFSFKILCHKYEKFLSKNLPSWIEHDKMRFVHDTLFKVFICKFANLRRSTCTSFKVKESKENYKYFEIHWIPTYSKRRICSLNFILKYRMILYL